MIPLPINSWTRIVVYSNYWILHITSEYYIHNEHRNIQFNFENKMTQIKRVVAIVPLSQIFSTTNIRWFDGSCECTIWGEKGPQLQVDNTILPVAAMKEC